MFFTVLISDGNWSHIDNLLLGTFDILWCYGLTQSALYVAGDVELQVHRDVGENGEECERAFWAASPDGTYSQSHLAAASRGEKEGGEEMRNYLNSSWTRVKILILFLSAQRVIFSWGKFSMSWNHYIAEMDQGWKYPIPQIGATYSLPGKALQ